MINDSFLSTEPRGVNNSYYPYFISRERIVAVNYESYIFTRYGLAGHMSVSVFIDQIKVSDVYIMAYAILLGEHKSVTIRSKHDKEYAESVRHIYKGGVIISDGDEIELTRGEFDFLCAACKKLPSGFGDGEFTPDDMIITGGDK